MSKYNKKDFKKPEYNYIRVGDDYYKSITKVKADKSTEFEWRKTTRQSILDDHDRFFLRDITKYDAFCNVPDHLNYEQILYNNFNSYYPFSHKAKKGSIKWTMRLLRHVFEEHIEYGLDYIQLLYIKPTQILPILCLVSYDNQTGKTTFLNWLNNVYVNNMAIIGNLDLQSQFNISYATKLVIAVDESKIDKNHVLEKIKALATSSDIIVNSKFITPYTIDFFGKIIMCSNYEDNFINAKNEDIRYWVRKLKKPEFENFNIEEDLIKEIPAFIYYMQNRKLNNKKESRMWFKADDIITEALQEIKKNSEETAIKHLKEYLTDKYDETNETELFATPTDINDIVFKNNSRIDPSYIRRLLRNKFNLKNADKVIRYTPLETEVYDYNLKEYIKNTKTGKPFGLKKDTFYLNNSQKTMKNDEKDVFLQDDKNNEHIENEDSVLPF